MVDEPFRPDDFDAINETYFAGLRSDRKPFADPSGWIETYSAAAEFLPDVIVPPSALGRYYLDEGNVLGSTKEDIVSLVSAWERRNVAADEVTLCHSISAGTLLILVALRRRGVRTIVFETPGYAVTMNQAAYLGFSTGMVPTYRVDGFHVDMARHVVRNRACALWITQPRMSLGNNQCLRDVHRLAEALGPEDYLAIDEATEQEFPSVLRAEEAGSHPRMVRIRGITKGMGLNGLRLAFILHDRLFRDMLESAQEVCGGSLDLFSLRAAAALAGDVKRFRLMLLSARHQTTSLRARAANLTVGSTVTVSPLVNGYMGSAWILLSDPGKYEQIRRNLLTFCRERRTAVILAASMRFAFDPTFEAVRLNYFNRETHVLEGVKTLVDFAASLRKTD
jgi:histidinol-phosphate/aromatic aminotransferase/cobyric acid decarboxylase-like protein